MRRNIAIFLLLSFVLAGCMVGPDYRRPTIAAPASYRFEDKEAKDVVNTAWWEQMDDPVLNDLITVALRENKDVMVAAARVEQFAGQYKTTRSALFPQIGAGATAGRERTSEVTGPNPLEGLASPEFNTYELFLNGSWEIDLWGKLRRATQAARADLLGTEEARRTVILTLVSSVALSYINLLDLDRQLAITKQTAKNYKETYDIFRLRYQYGIVSQIEVSQAVYQYERAVSNIPLFEKTIAQQENALSVLLGRNPGPIPRGRTVEDLVLPAVPAGLPSAILANRPDIREAEQSLIAANARIGVARAQYFPSISLTGILGLASSDLSKLFTGPARMWSWAVPVVAPIFTAGAIAGQVRSAKAAQQQALVSYQQAIQNAFREVDDALVDQQRTRQQLDALGREVISLQSYARLARLRYENGYASYLEVLDAETRLYDAELAYAQTKGDLFKALVNLYKALGGGWIVRADEIRVQPPGPSPQPFSSLPESAPEPVTDGGLKK